MYFASFNRHYPNIEALDDLAQDTIVDCEIAALDDAGRPNFNLPQHLRSQSSPISYFIFDLLVEANRDLTQLPLIERVPS